MGLLTLEQLYELQSIPLLGDNLKRKRSLYLVIARNVRDDAKKHYPQFQEIDRVDIVAAYIRKSDPDITAIAEKIKGISVQEICEIYARSVVGHEDDPI